MIIHRLPQGRLQGMELLQRRGFFNRPREIADRLARLRQRRLAHVEPQRHERVVGARNAGEIARFHCPAGGHLYPCGPGMHADKFDPVAEWILIGHFLLTALDHCLPVDNRLQRALARCQPQPLQGIANGFAIGKFGDMADLQEHVFNPDRIDRPARFRGPACCSGR